MALTAGSGPFSERSAGTFNFDRTVLKPHTLYLEGSPRRVRAFFGGECVVDSERAKLLHETGHLPVYYFPEEDVRLDLLQAGDRTTHCPFKGDASYWSVRVDGRVAENAVWGYPEPLEECPPISGLLAFYWNAMDSWFEEDEEVFIHPRDPYHRVDVLDSSRRVRITVGGEVVADSERPRILFETSLPPRYYLPPEDVRTDLLSPTDKTTGCPYKGTASYWTVEAGGERAEDVVWSYPEPIPAVEKIRDHLCFFNEKVDIEVDGERRERPETQWS